MTPCRKEDISMEEKKTAISRMWKDGTLYIIESVTSDTATETARDKVERLILNSLETLHKKTA